ncbi:MFS transporter [Mycolicibacterium stellerae]|uniref:MFS transporter n=1 Tax=Mycolicibacterium stellerae TaxID=2358193 RepID=UPI000F0B3176|nr:MFS transporter [Mycolicibacterium stellerae]
MTVLATEPQRPSMKRVAMASFVGSAIEYYDFYIYGTAAALVFPRVFFPHLGTTMATVASMATFAAAFLSRPIGAAFFGHFGDRMGRKSTLIATLSIMGLSTVMVGLVPGAATIGVAAPLILLTLRLIQGFAVGGEWAGAALLSAEYAPAESRGRYGMFTQMGVGSGLVMSSLLFLIVNQTIGEASTAFMGWGWRIPFLFSAVLIAIALYVRCNVAETPVFAAQTRVASVTPLAALFSQRREVVLAAGAMIGFFTLGYMANAYFMGYAHTHVGFSPDLILAVGLLGGVVVVVFNALSSVLSDTFGRRRVIMAALAVGVPWAFVVLPLIDTGNAALFTLAMTGTYAVAAGSYGPMAAFIPEIFGTRYRYTGAGVSLNVAGLVGGAVPTIAAAPLQASWGVGSIGLMMAAVVLISLVCTARLPETKGVALQEQ